MVPTSTRLTPDWRMTSGMRKPPPISTSWPREMIASRPWPSADRISSTAAALLLVTSASSAPVSRRSRSVTSLWREPRSPCVQVVLEVGVARGRRPRPPASAAGLSGARPRLVWMTTPEALRTGSEARARRLLRRAASTSRGRSSSACGQPPSQRRAARLVEHVARGLQRQLARQARQARIAQQAIDRRQIARLDAGHGLRF